MSIHLLSSSINLGSIGQKIDDTVGVTEFVIVPRDELDELVVKSNTSSSIEDGALSITHEIGAYNLVVGITEDTLQLVLRGLLDNSLDFFVGSTLINTNKMSAFVSKYNKQTYLPSPI